MIFLMNDKPMTPSYWGDPRIEQQYERDFIQLFRKSGDWAKDREVEKPTMNNPAKKLILLPLNETFQEIQREHLSGNAHRSKTATYNALKEKYCHISTSMVEYVLDKCPCVQKQNKPDQANATFSNRRELSSSAEHSQRRSGREEIPSESVSQRAPSIRSGQKMSGTVLEKQRTKDHRQQESHSNFIHSTPFQRQEFVPFSRREQTILPPLMSPLISAGPTNNSSFVSSSNLTNTSISNSNNISKLFDQRQNNFATSTPLAHEPSRKIATNTHSSTKIQQLELNTPNSSFMRFINASKPEDENSSALVYRDLINEETTFTESLTRRASTGSATPTSSSSTRTQQPIEQRATKEQLAILASMKFGSKSKTAMTAIAPKSSSTTAPPVSKAVPLSSSSNAISIQPKPLPSTVAARPESAEKRDMRTEQQKKTKINAPAISQPTPEQQPQAKAAVKEVKQEPVDPQNDCSEWTAIQAYVSVELPKLRDDRVAKEVLASLAKEKFAGWALKQSRSRAGEYYLYSSQSGISRYDLPDEWTTEMARRIAEFVPAPATPPTHSSESDATDAIPEQRLPNVAEGVPQNSQNVEVTVFAVQEDGLHQRPADASAAQPPNLPVNSTNSVLNFLDGGAGQENPILNEQQVADDETVYSRFLENFDAQLDGDAIDQGNGFNIAGSEQREDLEAANELNLQNVSVSIERKAEGVPHHGEVQSRGDNGPAHAGVTIGADGGGDSFDFESARNQINESEAKRRTSASADGVAPALAPVLNQQPRSSLAMHNAVVKEIKQEVKFDWGSATRRKRNSTPPKQFAGDTFTCIECLSNFLEASHYFHHAVARHNIICSAEQVTLLDESYFRGRISNSEALSLNFFCYECAGKDEKEYTSEEFWKHRVDEHGEKVGEIHEALSRRFREKAPGKRVKLEPQSKDEERKIARKSWTCGTESRNNQKKRSRKSVPVSPQTKKARSEREKEEDSEIKKDSEDDTGSDVDVVNIDGEEAVKEYDGPQSSASLNNNPLNSGLALLGKRNRPAAPFVEQQHTIVVVGENKESTSSDAANEMDKGRTFAGKKQTTRLSKKN